MAIVPSAFYLDIQEIPLRGDDIGSRFSSKNNVPVKKVCS